MHARVARFEGGRADAIRATTADIAAQARGGPPEGVPATGLLLLSDPQGGRALVIVLFENEADMRAGDAMLNEMSPAGEGMGRRTSVEMYEVAADVRM